MSDYEEPRPELGNVLDQAKFFFRKDKIANSDIRCNEASLTFFVQKIHDALVDRATKSLKLENAEHEKNLGYLQEKLDRVCA